MVEGLEIDNDMYVPKLASPIAYEKKNNDLFYLLFGPSNKAYNKRCTI